MTVTAVHIAHMFIKDFVKSGDIVIDATAGNGKDTLFLSTLIGNSGTIISIDIQKEAINRTQQLIAKHNPESNVLYVCDSHEHIGKIAQDYQHQISCIVFNLGYLPGADNTIYITKKDSTLKAIKSSIQLLNNRGILCVIAYRGHIGGLEEYDAIEQFMETLEPHIWHVIKSEAINQTNTAPIVLLASKRTY
jgi:16S rRNA C1402 N4-methylase RsmH